MQSEPKPSSKTLEERMARLEHDMGTLIQALGRMRELFEQHQRMFEAITGPQPDTATLQKAARARLN